jgi:hypothetical protein
MQQQSKGEFMNPHAQRKIRVGILSLVTLMIFGCAIQPSTRSASYPTGSFGPLVDDPNFSYWEERHENQNGDYIYDFGYQASASLGPDLLKRYVLKRAEIMCGHYKLNKYEEKIGTPLCGDGTEVRFVDAEVDCG